MKTEFESKLAAIEERIAAPNGASAIHADLLAKLEAAERTVATLAKDETTPAAELVTKRREAADLVEALRIDTDRAKRQAERHEERLEFDLCELCQAMAGPLKELAARRRAEIVSHLCGLLPGNLRPADPGKLPPQLGYMQQFVNSCLGTQDRESMAGTLERTHNTKLPGLRTLARQALDMFDDEALVAQPGPGGVKANRTVFGDQRPALPLATA